MLKSLVENRQIPFGWMGWVLWVYILPIAILMVVVVKLDSALLLDSLLSLSVSNIHFAWFALLLLPVNMGLDALSWFLIVRNHTPITYGKCVKLILSGRSMNVISPMGLGDAYLRYDQWPGAKMGSLPGIAIDRLVKMVPTFLLGVVSVLFLIKNGMTEMVSFLQWGLISMTIIGIITISLWKPFKNFLIKRFQKLKEVQGVQVSLIGWLLSVGVLRYFIFTSQFLLIFNWVGVQGDFTMLMMGICWIFFFKSMIPDVTVLGDLTKRELSALMFFSFFSVALDQVAIASLVVWLMNIVLPAIAGLFFLGEFKKCPE